MEEKEVSKNHPINKHEWSIAQKIADLLATFAGSWVFIFFIIILILIWTAANIYELIRHFDPYPFVFLNLVLGIITAVIAPIILMSQNRESQRDRVRAEYDYEINKKAEKEIREIKEQLRRIEKKLK